MTQNHELTEANLNKDMKYLRGCSTPLIALNSVTDVEVFGKYVITRHQLMQFSVKLP